MSESLTQKLAELKEIADRVTRGPWRYVNEIDPNPIFLQTWGPNYKTMHFVQAGGENDTPISSSLRNITPKITFLPKPDAEFIAQSRTIVPQLLQALEVATSALSALEQMGNDYSEVKSKEALSQIRKCLGVE